MGKNFVLVLMTIFAGSFAHAQFDNSFDDEIDSTYEVNVFGRHDDVDSITCESNDRRDNYCRANGNVIDARIVSRYSKSSCDEGRDWGFDRGGIWVKNGCRGQFEVRLGWGGGRPGPGGPRPGRPPMSEQIACNSESGRFASCQASYYIVDAYLARQVSKSACIEGQSWGIDRGRIWVDKGCRGVFDVSFR